MDAPAALLRQLLPSVVQIHAAVARDHPSAKVLGNERMGSGVIVDSSGLILTVNYVVMGAQAIHVAFVEGRRVKAELVAQDFDVGLAVLRVKRPGLPRATIGAADGLERGAPIVAVAATGVHERRVAEGVVTFLGEFEAYWEYLLDNGIVTSAPNPGFGGGGLFTVAGHLVGIVSLNLNEITRNSLSIPIDCYRRHEEEFLRHGRIVSRPRRAWLGVFAKVIEEGVVIAGLVPGGPADKSGLVEGDLIVSVNASEIGTRRDLYLHLWRHEPGERLTLEVVRDSKVRRVDVTGGDRAEFFRSP
jgi:S1-C subfamily serine protease